VLAFQFHYLDKLVIAGYFIILLFVGAKKSSSTNEGYILAGRQLTIPAFVAALVSTWYGGVLGVGEFCYKYGLSTWLIQGVPYYLFALIFSFFLVDKVRRTEIMTIPDRLKLCYGPSTGFVGSILIFIHSIPATKVLMLGVIFQLVLGGPLSYSIIAAAVFSTVYIFIGGFHSIVRTGKLQFILMIISFAVILPFALSKVGGISAISAKLPHTHLTITGGHKLSYIFVWFSFAIWTLIAPSFHQRCAAAKTSVVAKRGIIISVFFWMILDGMLTLTGLCASAILPNVDPIQAYPALADMILPPFLKGVFFAGLFSFIMSALDSHYHIGSVTFAYDIIRRRNDSVKVYFRMGLLLTLVMSISLAIFFPSVVKLWYLTYTVTVPALFLPIMLSYFPLRKMSDIESLVVMVSGLLSSVVWLTLGNEEDNFLGLEPFFAGMIVSFGAYVVSRMLNLVRKNYASAIS